MPALGNTYDVEARETIANTEEVRVHTLHLAWPQAVPWHKHSVVDDTFVCMWGSMIVATDVAPREICLRPGEMYKVEAGVAHSVRPGSNLGTKFLVIQATGRHDYIPDTGRSMRA